MAFYSASDIPGVNSFVAYFPTSEEVFCSDTVKYYNQPVGIVVAEDQLTAEKGAELVNITYTASETQPLFTVRQVLQAGDQTRLTIGNVVNPERTGNLNDLSSIANCTISLFCRYRCPTCDNRKLLQWNAVPLPHGNPVLFRCTSRGWLRCISSNAMDGSNPIRNCREFKYGH